MSLRAKKRKQGYQSTVFKCGSNAIFGQSSFRIVAGTVFDLGQRLDYLGVLTGSVSWRLEAGAGAGAKATS
jgi:hypothetical protein